jgi:hypothetical protein
MPLQLGTFVSESKSPPQSLTQNYKLIAKVPEVRRPRREVEEGDKSGVIDIELANLLFVGCLAYLTFIDFCPTISTMKTFIELFLATFVSEDINITGTSRLGRFELTFGHLERAIEAFGTIENPPKLVRKRIAILSRLGNIKLFQPKDGIDTVADYLKYVTTEINEDYVIGGKSNGRYCKNDNFNALMEHYVENHVSNIAKQGTAPSNIAKKGTTNKRQLEEEEDSNDSSDYVEESWNNVDTGNTRDTRNAPIESLFEEVVQNVDKSNASTKVTAKQIRKQEKKKKKREDKKRG